MKIRKLRNTPVNTKIVLYIRSRNFFLVPGYSFVVKKDVIRDYKNFFWKWREEP